MDLLAILVLCASLSGLGRVSALVNLQGSVVWNELCPNYRALGFAQVLLDDGQARIVNIGRSGQFLVPEVPGGEHLLSVRAHDHVFEQVLVQVSLDGNNISKIVPYIPGTITSTSAPQLPYPIKLSAVSRHEYYIPHESFNIMAMFGNPMTLMMVVGAVLIFATPYLSKLVDPEAMKEVQGALAENRATPAAPGTGGPSTSSTTPKEGPATSKAARRPPVSASISKGRTNKARKK